MDEARSRPLTAAAEPWAALVQALEALTGYKPAQLVLSIGLEDAFVSLMSLAAVSWAQLRLLDESHKRTLENWAQAYAIAGYERAALELGAGLAIARNLVLEAPRKRPSSDCSRMSSRGNARSRHWQPSSHRRCPPAQTSSRSETSG